MVAETRNGSVLWQLMPRTLFQCAIIRLIVRSRAVSKPRDWQIRSSHRFEKWQPPVIFQSDKTILVKLSCLRGFRRSYDKTFYRISKRRPRCLCQPWYCLLSINGHYSTMGTQHLISATPLCNKIWLFAILGHNGCTAAYSGASLVLCQYRKWVK